MGEWIWTEYTIGGAITAADIDELIEIAGDHVGGLDIDAVRAAIAAGRTIHVEGECNYGNCEELDAFLVEKGLSFHASYPGLSGEFSPGMRYWRPGMEKVAEGILADDDGTPSMNLIELREELKAGKDLSQVVAELSAMTADAVPPLRAHDLFPATV